MKTFWGWRDQQLPDGTVIWTAPNGHTYISTPGSAMQFPSLCAPTGDLTPTDPDPARPCNNRTAARPRRRRTRAQNHSNYIATERRRNRQHRQHQQANTTTTTGPPPPPGTANNDPPPF